MTLCERAWAFRTGDASAGATKSRQGTATASAAVTFLIREGATGIKFTGTGQEGTRSKTIAKSSIYGDSQPFCDGGRGGAGRSDGRPAARPSRTSRKTYRPPALPATESLWRRHQS